MGGNSTNIGYNGINTGGNGASIGGNDEKIKYSVKSKVYFRPKIWTRMDEKLKIVQKERCIFRISLSALSNMVGYN